MKTYRLTHQLLDLVEQFEAENVSQSGSLQDFAGFLLNRLQHPESDPASSEVRFGDEEPEAQKIAFQVDNNISRLVIFMTECTFLRLNYKFVDYFPRIYVIAGFSFFKPNNLAENGMDS